MIHIVELWIIKRPAKERDDIMATSAPPGRFDIAITFQGDLTGFTHTEQVWFVVKRTEMVRAVEPALVSVLVAIQTVTVHHQSARGNEIT